MDTQATIAILNQLFALEQHSLPRRLIESATFVSARSAADFNCVQQMARASRRHAAALADRIQALGGVPQPSPPPTLSAALHFQELAHARPALIADLRNTIRECTLAAQHLSDAPHDAHVIAAILADHQRNLEKFTPHGSR